MIAAFTNNPQAEGIEFCRQHKIKLKIINHKNYPDREIFDQKFMRFLKR